MQFYKIKNILVVALIAVINALGYGIVIPVLYSYSRKYGLSDFENGLLFAIFSVCQFISTPLIGRMSDKYGRRPLLLISLIGTAASFFIMAFAPSAFFLFIARALDGITAGNLPVAQAIISDSTTAEDRTRGFGIIGASFGFGFVFGPAISAFTVGISLVLPFIIAGVVSVLAVIFTFFYLSETNQHMGEVSHAKLFDFKKLYEALFRENIGPTLLITLFYFLSFSLFIYAFQPFSVKMLHLSANQISLLFMGMGVVGLFMQAFLTQRLAQKFELKKLFTVGLLLVALSFFIEFMSGNLALFATAIVILGIANGIVQPLVNTILSRETDSKSQGTIMGLNGSYMSIGQIIGPILGGAIATLGISYPFLAGGAILFICVALSRKILRPTVAPESAF
ncbi:MAG: MFS transporter [Candidatus Doudnabacteria bacterium]|nr:MFS transporter [Candidatus Doudnabacteria bacterium]